MSEEIDEEWLAGVCDDAEQVPKLEARIAKLRVALEFYVNTPTPMDQVADFGKTAREALREDEETP